MTLNQIRNERPDWVISWNQEYHAPDSEVYKTINIVCDGRKTPMDLLKSLVEECDSLQNTDVNILVHWNNHEFRCPIPRHAS